MARSLKTILIKRDGSARTKMAHAAMAAHGAHVKQNTEREAMYWKAADQADRMSQKAGGGAGRRKLPLLHVTNCDVPLDAARAAELSPEA